MDNTRYTPGELASTHPVMGAHPIPGYTIGRGLLSATRTTSTSCIRTDNAYNRTGHPISTWWPVGGYTPKVNDLRYSNTYDSQGVTAFVSACSGCNLSLRDVAYDKLDPYISDVVGRSSVQGFRFLEGSGPRGNPLKRATGNRQGKGALPQRAAYHWFAIKTLTKMSAAIGEHSSDDPTCLTPAQLLISMPLRAQRSAGKLLVSTVIE